MVKTALWVTAGAVVAAGAFTLLASPTRFARYWNFESKLVMPYYWKQKSQWR